MSDTATTPTTGSTANQGASGSLSLLARETFGANFHGEVKEPEPEKKEPEGEEGVETDGAVEPEEGAEPEQGAEAEGEETEPEKSGDGEENTEGEEVPISSLNELIEHFELDPEWATSLKVPVKVDGKQTEATLSELVKSYQIGEAAEKRLEEAKTKAHSMTEELAQKHQSLDAQFNVAAKLIETAEKALDKDTSSIDWATLRQDDPAEYSARKAEVSERRQEIEQMKRETVESYQQTATERQQQGTEQLKAHLAEQQQALLENLPEWTDEATAKTEKTKLVTYLKSQLGFDEKDIMGATDHRLILMARKAMLFDEGKAKVNAAKKKVAKVPKTLKPGAPKPQEQISKERADKLKAQLRKSGSLDDAFALLRAKRGAS